MAKPVHTRQSKDRYGCTVSVIMPARNAQGTLERALSSVTAQTFDDWEMLVVDDGSTDGTKGLAAGFAAKDPRIRLFRNDVPIGAAGTRNVALKHATGRFVAFLDADDAWHPEKLARQLAHIRQTGAGLSFTGFNRVTGHTTRQVHVPERIKYEQLLRGNCIGCLTVIYDRAVFGKVPMPEIPMRHDYALWLTLLAKGAVAYGLDEPLADYHANPASLSGDKWQAARATWRMYRDIFGIGRLGATYYLSSHLARRLLRG